MEQIPHQDIPEKFAELLYEDALTEFNGETALLIANIATYLYEDLVDHPGHIIMEDKEHYDLLDIEVTKARKVITRMWNQLQPIEANITTLFKMQELKAKRNCKGCERRPCICVKKVAE